MCVSVYLVPLGPLTLNLSLSTSQCYTHAHTSLKVPKFLKMSQLTCFKKRERASERGFVPVKDIWMWKLLCHSVTRQHQLGVLTCIWEKCCMRHLARAARLHSTAVWLLVMCLKATWAAHTHRTYVWSSNWYVVKPDRNSHFCHWPSQTNAPKRRFSQEALALLSIKSGNREISHRIHPELNMTSLLCHTVQHLFIHYSPGVDTPNNSIVSQQIAPSGTFSYFLHASRVACIFNCSFVMLALMEQICNLLKQAKMRLTACEHLFLCATVGVTAVYVVRHVCVKEMWQSCLETHCVVAAEGKASFSMSALTLEPVWFILGCRTFSLSVVDFTVTWLYIHNP